MIGYILDDQNIWRGSTYEVTDPRAPIPFRVAFVAPLNPYNPDGPQAFKNGQWFHVDEPSPVVPAPVYKRSDLTYDQFVELFTFDERTAYRTALEAARETLKYSPGNLTTFEAILLDINDRRENTALFGLDSPSIVNSLDFLEIMGLLPEGRKAVVLSGAPPSI